MYSKIREAIEYLARKSDYDDEKGERLAEEALALLDAPECTRPDRDDCHAKINTGGKCMNGFQCPPLDAPVASDAREVALSVLATFGEASTPGYHFFKMDDQPGSNEASAIIESFAADCQRKAREETARKCADVVAEFLDTEGYKDYHSRFRLALSAAIMEAAHE